MFMKTVSCFIKKNTPELKELLKNLGCIYGGKASEANQPYLYYNCGRYWEVNSKPARGFEVVDCGDNEELFLAILSIYDCTDMNQWFVSEKGNFVICSGNTFDPYKEGLSLEDCRLKWHKASIDELITYFK